MTASNTPAPSGTTTTTPFDIVMLNDLDRVPGLGAAAGQLRQQMVGERLRARAYTRAHGKDDPAITDWTCALRRGDILMSTRLPLSKLGLPTGKRARLHRTLYRHGLDNGTAMFLPYDQGLELGPRGFVTNPAAADPAYIVRLAVEGGFNGVAMQVGNAEKFFAERAGEVPLILKLNGCTEVPSADARHRMPIVVWAYPRGSAVQAAGGQDSFYAVDYAARTAAELGADAVKVNLPDPSATTGVPEPYDRAFSTPQALASLRHLSRTRPGGATGVIDGRNIWQREHDESLRFAAQLRDILARYPAVHEDLC